MRNLSGFTLLFLTSVVEFVFAFQSSPPTTTTTSTRTRAKNCGNTILFNSNTLTSEVEDVLKSEYPLFHELIFSKNAQVWKSLSEACATSEEDREPGFTIFAPNDAAMRSLGERRLEQLDDVRNLESAEKMASFHAVDEVVEIGQLFNSAGVVTLGGVVDVGRTVVGGFMGIGGKEDGGTTVNGAKVLQTLEVGSEDVNVSSNINIYKKAFIHETDALISPEILWRYFDQLRIPGSK